MLEAINITKRYDRSVLDGISFAVQPGGIVGVVGKSGSGKSTLLRLLNLIETPDSGELLFDGKRIDPLNKKQLLHAQQEIGMIFQNYNLLHNRTVFENVYLPLKLLKMLSFVGMEDKVDIYPAKLSGGEKQRVAIARALIREPKILLCDEPTSALDEDTKADVLALLQKVQQTFQPAVIFVSHELTAVRQICQRVFVLEDAVFAAEFVNHPQPIVRKESSYVDKVERSLLHDDQ